MYKRTKYKVAFYPAYVNACNYFRDYIDNEDYHNNHDSWLVKYEDWLESQGAYFHRRDPHMKQNHNLFFASDEQRTIFLLRISQ